MKKINLYGLLLIGGSLLCMTACKKSKTEANESKVTPRAAVASTPLDPKNPIYGLPFPAVLAYVGINDQNVNNMGCFLKNDGKPAVNIVNVFAANINMSQESTPRPVVSLNPYASYMLRSTSYVKNLKAKGIKVTLTLLNNHDSSGWSQFTTQEEADNFAKCVKVAVDKFGLDGIEIDDEYSKGRGNDKSIPMVLTAIRKLLPNIIIGYYIYSDSGIDAGAMLGKISSQITYAITDYPASPARFEKYFRKDGIFVGDNIRNNSLERNIKKVVDGKYGGIMLFTGGDYTASQFDQIAKGFYGSTFSVANPPSDCLLKGGDKAYGLKDSDLFFVLSNGKIVKKKN